MVGLSFRIARDPRSALLSGGLLRKKWTRKKAGYARGFGCLEGSWPVAAAEEENKAVEDHDSDREETIGRAFGLIGKQVCGTTRLIRPQLDLLLVSCPLLSLQVHQRGLDSS